MRTRLFGLLAALLLAAGVGVVDSEPAAANHYVLTLGEWKGYNFYAPPDSASAVCTLLTRVFQYGSTGVAEIQWQDPDCSVQIGVKAYVSNPYYGNIAAPAGCSFASAAGGYDGGNCDAWVVNGVSHVRSYQEGTVYGSKVHGCAIWYSNIVCSDLYTSIFPPGAGH